MASKVRRHRSQEVGLSIGYLIGHHLLGMQRLNLGHWTEELPVSLANLPRAQERYDEHLLSYLPPDLERVLEVGCGTGQLALAMVERGLAVDVVSPNPFLTRIARESLGDRVEFFECAFEELDTERHYDAVVFSESYQYVEWGVPLPKSVTLLRPGGYLLICDFFNLLPLGESAPFRGGRRLSSFYDQLADLPLEMVTDLDITEQVAPGLGLVRDADANLLTPIYRLLMEAGRESRPWLTRLLRLLARKKLARFEHDVIDGRRVPESFRETKSYRLFLLRKRG